MIKEMLKPEGWTEEQEEVFQKVGEEFRALYKEMLEKNPYTPFNDAGLELMANAFGKGFGQGYLYALKRNSAPE